MKDCILLVEDDDDEVTLAMRVIRRYAAPEVVVARDGAQALDFMFGTGCHAGRDPSIIPLLVLLDLKLTGVTGLEVLRRIREDARTRRTPVVVRSSSTEEKDIWDSYALGANSYLRKQLGDRFREELESVLHYWLVTNTRPPLDRHTRFADLQPLGTAATRALAGEEEELVYGHSTDLQHHRK